MRLIYAILIIQMICTYIVAKTDFEQEFYIPQGNNSWFEMLKKNVRNNPNNLREVFKMHFSQENNNGNINNIIKNIIENTSIIDYFQTDINDQNFGSLVAKFSRFPLLGSSKFSVLKNNHDFRQEIMTQVNTIDFDLTSNGFSALSIFEEQKTNKTKQLLQNLKLSFHRLQENSEIDENALHSFMYTKLLELKYLKKQSRNFKFGYRAALKIWIRQTEIILSTFENFKIPNGIKNYLIQSDKLISATDDDEDFVGEVIGEMMIAKIHPHIEAGNHTAAITSISNILTDLSVYTAILSNSIALCAWMTSFPVGPAVCFFGLSVVSFSTVLLISRIVKNLMLLN
ncbi:hypothetical protein QEN19_002074 [Hanseniaspora menglaensis]